MTRILHGPIFIPHPNGRSETMERSQRIAHGLIAKYGALDGFWIAMRRVRGWVCDGTAPERVQFWREVREVCYHRIGKTEMWT